MSGAYSRNKGKRGELELVHMFRDNLGLACNRNYKQVAEAQHGDIEQLVGPYLVEAKNHATPNPKAWRKQTPPPVRKTPIASDSARDRYWPCPPGQ